MDIEAIPKAAKVLLPVGAVNIDIGHNSSLVPQCPTVTR